MSFGFGLAAFYAVMIFMLLTFMIGMSSGAVGGLQRKER
jgi:hypothetical protein